jgi:polyferredoxin
MAVGAAVAIVGALLPWIRTGGRARNSFDLFRLADDLGFAPDGPAANAIRWWPLVPLLAVVAVVAAWWGWARPGGAVGVVAALYTLTVGLAILAAPTRGRVLARSVGATVTTLGGALLLAGSIAVLIVGQAVTSPPSAR